MARVCDIILLICLHMGVAISVMAPKNSDPFLQQLFDRTSQDQIKEDVPFVPYKGWQKTKGVYASGIKLNFHGKFDLAESRRMMDVFDNNMFVMAWVTSSLLEANKFGGAPRPAEEQLTLSLNVLKEYQDKNKPYNTSTMTFWPQQYNTTTKYWESTPANLLGAFTMANSLPLPLIESFLKAVGLDDLAKDIQSIMNLEYILKQAFHIPPDFDDTFVNLGLGSLLYELKGEFSSMWNLWSKHNPNITSVFDALKRNAYRPFSTDRSVNSIDPRTYVHIRGFLDKAKANGQDVTLVPTWIQNIDDLRTDYYHGVGMPFSINNVDVTVSANTIFGITASVLSGIVSPSVLQDPQISQIYQNTSSLIAFEIKDNFTGRADLALTYYPSRIEFYWFVARTLSMMETALKIGPLPVAVMNTVHNTLKDALEGSMTKYILSNGQSEGPDKTYFDDFLGDGDITHDGRPLIRGEDRIFTTAMAANALIFTWTIHDNTTGKSHWKEGTPEEVQKTVLSCVNWLREHTLDGSYDPWNAFFSGSGKGAETLPFRYPSNRFEYLNGTVIHDTTKIPKEAFLYAMEGYVPTEQYNDMLKEKHFGMPTPLNFNGYNSDPGFFPLWSSIPYTYVTTLLAVSRYENVVG